jgi:hypothetical protein
LIAVQYGANKISSLYKVQNASKNIIPQQTTIMHINACLMFLTGMKSIPRFRESVAFIRLRHQPPQIKYPLVALHIASNPSIYDADQVNVKDEVNMCFSQILFVTDFVA